MTKNAAEYFLKEALRGMRNMFSNTVFLMVGEILLAKDILCHFCLPRAWQACAMHYHSLSLLSCLLIA